MVKKMFKGTKLMLLGPKNLLYCQKIFLPLSRMTPTPPPNTSASSAAISLCKIALMAGVVLIHSSVLAYLSPETATGWGAFLVTFISEGLASACVPLFYFLSGYLFFARWTFTWNGYKSKLRRRMWSLLVPYILWNCVGFCSSITKPPTSRRLPTTPLP